MSLLAKEGKWHFASTVPNKMLQMGSLTSPQSICKMILNKYFHTNKHIVEINKSHENIPQQFF